MGYAGSLHCNNESGIERAELGSLECYLTLQEPPHTQDSMRRKLRVREPSVLDSSNSGNNTVIHKRSTSTEQNNKFGSRCTRE